VIVLVVGGTRSGKSEVAERVAEGCGGAITYVATGVATDPDMAARIAAHRARRPAAWSTVEATDALVTTLSTLEGTVIVDSLGSWLASSRDGDVDAGALCRALRTRSGHTVLVTEEVGMSVHAPTAAGRRFADRLGAINRDVAAIADDVLLVVAGCALRLEPVDVLLRLREGTR
jgi:adenosyl cobinamide kinase/adenosyl cobinamide phosphate guanylyltransferase